MLVVYVIMRDCSCAIVQLALADGPPPIGAEKQAPLGRSMLAGATFYETFHCYLPSEFRLPLPSS